VIKYPEEDLYFWSEPSREAQHKGRCGHIELENWSRVISERTYYEKPAANPGRHAGYS
jgi:hypothetical protein